MTLRPLAALSLDVFRRTVSSGFAQLIAAGIAALALFCLLLTPDKSGLALFNRTLVPAPDADTAARSLLFHAVLSLGDVFGMALILIGTAGIMPTFLEPSSAAVLLSKPTSRSILLLGRFAGMAAFVGLAAAAFLVALSVAVGVRTGVWAPQVFAAWPLLVVNFAAFASLGTLVAVMSRNTVAVMLGSLFFAVLSWGIGIGRLYYDHAMADNAARRFGRVVDLAYWLLPKPVDASLILHEQLSVPAKDIAGLGLKAAFGQGHGSPATVVATGLAVAACLLAIAAYELEHQDY
jgi:ABC-type transport system involved in multi-copper enzyme maturation permease subunit